MIDQIKMALKTKDSILNLRQRGGGGSLRRAFTAACTQQAVPLNL
jgi:hypothetical protein